MYILMYTQHCMQVKLKTNYGGGTAQAIMMKYTKWSGLTLLWSILSVTQWTLFLDDGTV